MGLIMKNGIAYGGSGGGGTASDTTHIELTYAEYQNLERNGRVDSSATYFITDENINSISNANSIMFDNTNSELESTNVQDAIIEVSQKGGGKIITLTQEEYDNLPDTKYTDGILYAIEDGEELTAKNLEYDGSQTGLGSNVQDAVDGLNKNLEWKLAGSTNTGEVLLPSDFTELNILHSSSKSNYVIHMCRELVSDVGYNISNGYYVSADNSDVTTIFVSQTKVKGMYNVSQIVVYYR